VITADDLRNLAREVPLLGGLVDCDGPDHWEALGQTFVVLLLSTTPIWLATLIIYGMGTDLKYSALTKALGSTVAKGELFMYCTALLAPIFWIALVDPPLARKFPSKVSHMVFIVVIDVVAAVFFGLTIAGKQLNEVFTFEVSMYMFLFSIVLLYLGTVYHISRIADGTAEFKKQETDFTAAVREHRQ
jgi:hypothetical protein